MADRSSGIRGIPVSDGRDWTTLGKEMTAAIRTAAAEAEAAVKAYCAVQFPTAQMYNEVGGMISRGIAEEILSGTGFINGASETFGRSGSRVRGTDTLSGGRNVTQYIYLRDSDASPYRTARRIRRESEVIFRN